MLCYRDRTFCNKGRVCGANEDCSRILWPSMERQANELNLPIATFGEGYVPVCFIPLRDKKGQFTKRW